MNLRLAHTVLLSSALCACASQPMAPLVAGAPALRTVSVSGTATARVTPDIVEWQVITTSNDPDLVRAKQASDAQMQAVLKTARDLGVPDEDLQTGHLSVRKEYERGSHASPRFKHFRVTRQLSIKQRGTEQFDNFLTGLVASADMEVNYRLTSSKIESLRKETRRQAVAAARDKASAMAEELGEALGHVLEINEEQENHFGGHRGLTNVSFQSLDSGGSNEGGTFAPGTIEVRVSIRAKFALR